MPDIIQDPPAKRRRGPTNSDVGFEVISKAREATLDQAIGTGDDSNVQQAGIAEVDAAVEAPVTESVEPTSIEAPVTPALAQSATTSLHIGGDDGYIDQDLLAELLRQYEEQYGEGEKNIGVRVPQWLLDSIEMIVHGYNLARPLGKRHVKLTKERFVTELLIRGLAASPQLQQFTHRN
jgi:hypothetical protein